MAQMFNPYLPGGEYVPDGEPHVFGDRVYVYGSHDRFGAPMFCMNDYVCWSAPILPDDDPAASDAAGGPVYGPWPAQPARPRRNRRRLGEWRYEGVIYRKNQDPKNRLGLRLLFAPDVALGPDGRYYLYYAFDFMGVMGVAVADDPAGPFEFHGHVHYADGTLWGRREGDSFPFDPGVLVDDDGRVYLYSGFSVLVPPAVTGGVRLGHDGGVMVELEPDMLTIAAPERLVFPNRGEGSFPGHEFFEASSIRKYDGMYYFVYSSRLNHELCYAVSDRPDGGFRYGGTLVSNGDIGLPGVPDERHARNYTGNNHGGLLRLGDDFYVFYHRQTNRSSYARQACAERLDWHRGGGAIWFAQAEMTSCGLNGGPLAAEGTYEARIACDLWSDRGTGRYDGAHPKRTLRMHPYFTQDEPDGSPAARQYVANMGDGATAGYKYFDFGGDGDGGDAAGRSGRLTVAVLVRAHRGDGVRGDARGMITVGTDPEGGDPIMRIPVSVGQRHRAMACGAGERPRGVRPLYLTYHGSGAIDMLSFTLGR